MWPPPFLWDVYFWRSGVWQQFVTPLQIFHFICLGTKAMQVNPKVLQNVKSVSNNSIFFSEDTQCNSFLHSIEVSNAKLHFSIKNSWSSIIHFCLVNSMRNRSKKISSMVFVLRTHWQEPTHSSGRKRRFCLIHSQSFLDECHSGLMRPSNPSDVKHKMP